MADEQLEVARFYRTRKYAKKMGRFLDGTKIPGGPYSMPQGIAALVLGFGLIITNPLWTSGTIFLDLPLGIGALYGGVWLVGKIRFGNSDPITAIVGAFNAATSSAAGTFEGRPYQEPRPMRAHGRVVIDPRAYQIEPALLEPLVRDEPLHRPAAATETQPAPVATSSSVSAVARLLAQTTTNR